MNTGILRAIKSGDDRIILNNVTHVTSRMSKDIQVSVYGISENPYAVRDGDNPKQEGLVVTIYFTTPNENTDYVRLYLKDAENFLAEFDAIMGVQ